MIDRHGIGKSIVGIGSGAGMSCWVVLVKMDIAQPSDGLWKNDFVLILGAVGTSALIVWVAFLHRL